MCIKTYQKNGKRSGKQRYRCNDCGYIFENNRRKSINLAAQLWDQYVNGNQTINSLCKHYDISPKRVRRLLDNFEIKSREIIPVKCILIMDTSYFRCGFGVMVFRCHPKHQNMFWKFVDHETVAKYQSGVSYLQSKGLEIMGIVCDGKRGLFSGFGAIPVQMCHFHQVAIITRYITRNPRLQAGVELKTLVHKLTIFSKTEFTNYLKQWYNKWKGFLSEKTYDDQNNKWHFTHRRLRSAYRSLKTNLPFLFTYLEYPDLGIPNTTNSLEGTFTNLKTKLRIHSGVKEWRKRKIIGEILSK